MIFSYLEVPANRFLVVAAILPMLRTLDNLSAALGGNCWASGVVFIDLTDQVRSVFVGDSQRLSVHTRFLIHANSSLWLFRIDKALLGLAKVSTLKLKLGLVQEDFGHRLRMVLSCDL